MELSAILIASLLGSLHCVAMCGGFIPLIVEGDTQVSGGRIRALVLYHLGRGWSYTALGFVAGTVGQAFNQLFSGSSGKGLAALLVGLSLIGAGILALLRSSPPQQSLVGIGSAVDSPSWYRSVAALIQRSPAHLRAILLGVGSVALPCGWLYTYVALAAAAGSSFGGALVMFVFWIGTVPALWLAGTVFQPLFQRIQRAVPRLAIWVMILSGGAAIWFHTHHDHSQHTHGGHHHHDLGN